jgi:hypothetical protein
MNHPTKKSASTLPLVRCAVYTRKSTEEGLEQEFNSLDAQRESAEAFVRSQAHEGWTCLTERYDDGGFTGGNKERPALQRLLADIRAGKIDCVVCYKVDRLSRSLLDFAKMMETFEQHGVSFVSITQQFNSATSMGRLVLNVLLTFAQFERGVPGPARVSGERHGTTGGRLAFAGPDRPVGVVTAALVLHPVRAAARHADQHGHYLGFGDLRYRLLDLAPDVEEPP